MNIVVFITAPDKKQAKKIAVSLVDKGIAACVNIIPCVDSIFKWQGNLDIQKECLLIVKTKRPLFPKLIKAVKSLHSYQVPEIIALEITAGNKEYLDWINESTGKSA